MNVTDLRALGALIRERRKEARLSIGEAAELLGVGRRLLIELEHGHRRASVDTVLKTLNALGLEMHVERKRLGTSSPLPFRSEPSPEVAALRSAQERRPTQRKKNAKT